MAEGGRRHRGHWLPDSQLYKVGHAAGVQNTVEWKAASTRWANFSAPQKGSRIVAGIEQQAVVSGGLPEVAVLARTT